MSGQEAEAPAQVGTPTQGSGGSRHTNRTNSVNGSDGGESVESDSLPSPSSRVREFCDEYPDLAEMPLTMTPGQRLRESLFDEEYVTRYVEAEQPLEDSFPIQEVVRREPMTWKEAVRQLLESHEDSRHTTLKFERGTWLDDEFEEFSKPAETSWMHEYQRRYFAELKAWTRETVGGVRPSGGECEGSFDDPHVVLLTRTASSCPNQVDRAAPDSWRLPYSVPDGRRQPPVDHAEQLRQSWEPVYHTIRNRLRSLGFESDEWDYYRKEEPHTSKRGGGLNRCYTHEHTLLIVDGPITADQLTPILDKHVDECEWAGPDAHTAEKAIEIKRADEVEDVAAYVASYTGIQPADLLERSIEYIAWASVQWAMNSNRRTRSNASRWAAMADACKQRFESDKSEQSIDHAVDLVTSDRRGVDIECAECGSPWGIDQEQTTLPTPETDGQSNQAIADGGFDIDLEDRLRERHPNADAAFRMGLAPSKQKKRNRILEYKSHNSDATPQEICGALRIDPAELKFVRETIAGVDHTELRSFERDREPDWRLVAVEIHGEEHRVESSNGVSMADAILPEERLLRETRLRYVGIIQTPSIVTGEGTAIDRIVTHNPEYQARRLAKLGLTDPWAAELHLDFERRNPGIELRSEFEEPVSKPP